MKYVLHADKIHGALDGHFVRVHHSPGFLQQLVVSFRLDTHIHYIQILSFLIVDRHSVLML